MLTLLVVSGCGDDSDDEAADPPATTEPEPTDTTTTTEVVADESSSTEEQVVAAYMAAVDAKVAAFDPPDPDHPDLLATHTGPQLTNLQDHLQERAADGASLVVTNEVFADPADVDLVDDETATVLACIEETIQEVATESGEPLDDETDQTADLDVMLRLDDGEWKVVSETAMGPGPPSGCAEE